jgi:hypothetical protein
MFEAIFYIEKRQGILIPRLVCIYPSVPISRRHSPFTTRAGKRTKPGNDHQNWICIPIYRRRDDCDKNMGNKNQPENVPNPKRYGRKEKHCNSGEKSTAKQKQPSVMLPKTHRFYLQVISDNR